MENLHTITCPNCGTPFSIETKLLNQNNVFCPYCGTNDEYCHFPDYQF